MRVLEYIQNFKAFLVVKSTGIWLVGLHPYKCYLSTLQSNLLDTFRHDGQTHVLSVHNQSSGTKSCRQ
jgi:hypothetical protein